MADLKQIYERAGFVLTSVELPDYLPVLLEYLSQRDETEVRRMLADCAHIVRSIGEALLWRGSRYAAVPEAVLGIAGVAPLDRVRASQRGKARPQQRLGRTPQFRAGRGRHRPRVLDRLPEQVMTPVHDILFDVYPYICLVVLLLGSIVR